MITFLGQKFYLEKDYTKSLGRKYSFTPILGGDVTIISLFVCTPCDSLHLLDFGSSKGAYYDLSHVQIFILKIISNVVLLGCDFQKMSDPSLNKFFH